MDIKQNQLNKTIPLDTNKLNVWSRFIYIFKIIKFPIAFLFFIFILTFIGNQANLMFSDYQKNITSGNFDLVVVLKAVGLVLGGSLFLMLGNLFEIIATKRINRDLKKVLWEKILTLKVSFYNEYKPRDLISRVSCDADKFGAVVVGGIRFFVGLYSIIFILLKLFQYNYRLAVVDILILPITILLTYISGRIQFKYNARIQTKLSVLTQFLAEILSNISLVKVFVTEKKEKTRGTENIKILNDTKFKLGALNNVITEASNLISVASNIIIILYGSYLVSKGIITFPVLIAFLLFSSNMLTKFTQSISFWQQLKSVQGSVNFITQIFSAESENYSENKDNLKDVKSDSIVLKDLVFAYNDENVLCGVNQSISTEGMTAIVGSSGSGKSTLLALLERYYEPKSGCIEYGGKNITSYNLSEWRNLFGYVTQDVVLYSGTIQENIKYGLKRDVNLDEIIEVCKKVNIHDFIMTQPLEYNTKLVEAGASLSGGQKQCIALARTLLKNAPIIILDEATANLDAEKNSIVNECIESIAKEKTVIMIAHKISNIKKANKIIVMENGKIIGSGTHDYLSKTCGKYRELLDSENKTVTGGVN